MSDNEERQIKYGSGTDAPDNLFQDYVPEQLVRIYPYKAVYKKITQPLLMANSPTIVRISQKGVTEFTDLKTDDSGFRYVEAIMTASAGLDLQSKGTSVKTNRSLYKLNEYMAVVFDLVINDHQDAFFFTIGTPFNEFSYRLKDNTKQNVYFPDEIDYGFEKFQGTLSEEDLEHVENSKRTVAQLKLINVDLLLNEVSNASLFFTLNTNLGKNITTSDTINMRLDKQGLLSRVTGKGIVQVGNQDVGLSNISFYAKNKLMPFKVSFADDQNNLSFFASWFDYDFVMPFFMADKMKNGDTLDKIIINDDDRRFLEDMIIVSAGFAEYWKNAPVWTADDVKSRNLSPSDVGQIRSDYRVGHNAIPVYTIARTDNPQPVLDGFLIDHFLRYNLTHTRRQILTSAINALSGIIFSSNCTGGGGNHYHKALLPWYLEPMDPINTDNNKQKVEINVSGVATAVDTYLLPGTKYNSSGKNEEKKSTVRFRAASLYFIKSFTDKVNYLPNSTFELPENVDLSNILLFQTDRKVLAKPLPPTIQVQKQNHFPNDIDLEADDNLNYLFYLPINDQKTFKNFYIATEKQEIVRKEVNDLVDVFLPRGDINNQQTAFGYLLEQPVANSLTVFVLQTNGTLHTPTVISNVQSNDITITPADFNKYSFIVDKNKYISWNKKFQSEASLRQTTIENLKTASPIPDPSFRRYGTYGRFNTFELADELFLRENRYYPAWGGWSSSWIKIDDEIVKYKIYYLLLVDAPELFVNLSFDLLYVLAPIILKSNNLEYRYNVTSYGGNRYYIHVRFRGQAVYTTQYSKFTPARVKLTKVIENFETQSFAKREIIYDKLDWTKFVQASVFFPNQQQFYPLKIDEDTIINQLYQFTIFSIFSNTISVQFGASNEWLEFDTINKEDENVTMLTIGIV